MYRHVLFILLLPALLSADIVINEIHYDSEPNTRRDSYVELYNNGTNTVDLSGWHFDNGINFVFAPGTLLAPNEYLVVVETTNHFNEVIAMDNSLVDLADIVGGGDGSLPGTGTPSGIEAANGNVNQGNGGSQTFPANAGDYYSVSYDAVDGVFVPNGTIGAQQITSTGLTYDFVGSAGTEGSWRAWFNGTGVITDPSNAGGLTQDFTGDPDNHSLLAAHAQKGITFDLDQIEFMNGGVQVTNFTGIAGDSRPKVGGEVDIFIIMDGAVVASGLNIAGNEFAIDVPLAATNRFLTLVCSSSANGIGSDHGYFGDAFLHLDGGVTLVTNNAARVAGTFTGALSNDGETITLRNAFGEKMDEVDYGAAFPWPVGALGTGLSMELIHPDLDNDLAGSWRSGFEPTPGRTNTVLAANAAPQMRQVDHSPNQPSAGQAVVVEIKATDPDGVASLKLLYQVVEPGAYIPAYIAKATSVLLNDPNSPLTPNPAFENPTNWTEIAMSPIGDDRYQATIPGQINRTLVRYRIVAEDTLGASVRVPYLDDPSLNFAYYCYDGVPAYTATEQTVQPEGVPFIHSAETMNSLPIYTLLTTEADLAQCNGYAAADRIPSNNFDARSAFNWTGTFVYDGVVYDNIGYRLRQRNARYNGAGKRSMRFRFNRGHYAQFHDLDNKKYPTKWRAMNAHRTRGSRGTYNFGLVEISDAILWNLYKVPAPEAHWYHFRVVQRADEAPAGIDGQHLGDFYGYYTAMENYDRNFLEAHDLEQGNLYKLKSYNLEGSNIRRYQAPDAVDDGSDYENIIFNLRNTQPDSWLDQHVDYEHYNRYHTVVEAIRHFDVATNLGEHLKNRAFYFHPEPGTPYGLLRTLPWDADTSWGPNWNTGEDWVKAAIFSTVNRPEYVKRYRNAVREFRDLIWQPDQLNTLLDNMAARVAPLVPADRDRWNGAPAVAGQENTGDIAPKLADMKKFAWDGAPGSPQPTHWPGDFDAVARPMGTDDHLDSLGFDADIPDTPTITYTGPVGFPVNELSFQCSTFADPQGSGTFGAMEWRIGEVYNTNAPSFDPDTLMVFEYDLIWGSEPLTTYTNQVAVPSDSLLQGNTYRARVRFMDDTGRWSHWSAPAEFTAGTPSNLTALQDHLRLSEVMYHAPEGSDFDFIELYNTSDSLTLDIGGVSISEGLTFTFPSPTFIEPGDYLVVARLPGVAFDAHYGLPPGTSIGPYDKNLDNAGERITLLAPGGSQILIDFSYDNARGWPLAAAGAGHSLVPLLLENQHDGRLDHPIHWRASGSILGSPGAPDTVPEAELTINELAAHTDLNNPSFPDYDSNDWIELYNPSPVLSLQLSTNYYLSDDPAELQKWMIPDDVVAAAGWKSYDEITGFHQPITNGFGLNKGGEQLFLSHFPPGGTPRVLDSVRFKAQENGRSYGRYPDGHQNWYNLPLTRDAANQLEAVPHTVIIREIMFAPAGSNHLEYVELYNPGASAIDLFNTNGTWRLDGGISYSVPSNTTLAAGAYLVLVSFDPITNSVEKTEFIAAYNQNQLLGPYAGKLSNLGERLALEKPQATDPASASVDWIIVDEVYYYRDAPWPASMEGESLHRLHHHVAGNQPDNWLSTAGSPGIVFTPPILDPSLQWIAQLGAAYILEGCDDLKNPNWVPIGTLTGDGIVQYTGPDATNTPRRYYRLRVVE